MKQNIFEKIFNKMFHKSNCINTLKKQAGIVKLLEAEPGYRKYLTKEGETLIIKSADIANSNTIKSTRLSIEKSGGKSLIEPNKMDETLGPVLKFERDYDVRFGKYGEYGKEKIGPYIQVFDAGFHRDYGINLGRIDMKPLPKSRYNAYGITSDLKI